MTNVVFFVLSLSFIYFFQISAKFLSSGLFTWEVTRLIQVSSMIFYRINFMGVAINLFLLVSTNYLKKQDLF